MYTIKVVRSCTHNEVENGFKILTGKPTGERALGRPRHRWEDNIRNDLKKIITVRHIYFIQLKHRFRVQY
jgi:hypothetical protein